MPRRRHSVRLAHHGYDAGLHFVTVCTWRRAPLFGVVVGGEMVRSAAGETAHAEWLRTAEVRPRVVLDAFVVMPDHVHLLFGIAEGGTTPPVGATRRVAPTDWKPLRTATGPTPGSVGVIIGLYKSIVTKRIRQTDPAARVWQRGYHDRVVRTDREAEALRRYAAENPARWAHRPPDAHGHRA